mmetsp:Transcript_25440/g.70075  ORF Transcript_25440/g.70075 Transcript_25440/m.70075 type:complete len:630 (+) Transcript_25440:138-2027(+)
MTTMLSATSTQRAVPLKRLPSRHRCRRTRAVSAPWLGSVLASVQLLSLSLGIASIWNDGSSFGNISVSGFRSGPVSLSNTRRRKFSNGSSPPLFLLYPTNQAARHSYHSFSSFLLLSTDNETGNPNESPSLFEADSTRANIETSRSGSSSSLYAKAATPRTIRVERMPRLPVWPVWAGVIDFFVGWVLGPEAGSKLEQYFLGGRVCPMQLDGRTTSPFLLLVHHHHNFWRWDAIFRKLSALVLPEGFPAHPHRGFTTLTYFLPDENNGGGGGFIHRDSIGVKQTYGTKGSYQNQAQWLFTGSGMLHEELFDFSQEGNPYQSNYELYQLWVNVPGFHKLDPPKVQLLRTGSDGATEIDESIANNNSNSNNNNNNSKSKSKSTSTTNNGEGIMPSISTRHRTGATTTTCNVVVLAGSYRPHESSSNGNNESGLYRSEAAPLHSDLSVLHVSMESAKDTEQAGANKEESEGWIYDIPQGHETLIVYVRKGSCTMSTRSTTTNTNAAGKSELQPIPVPIHSTVFVESSATTQPTSEGLCREQLVVTPNAPGEVVDLLVLSGRPLYESSSSSSSVIEPVAMQGSMVMNHGYQIEEAYRDYQLGKMGVPWDYQLDDEEWKAHVRSTTQREREPYF